MRNMKALVWLLIAMNVVGPQAFAVNKIQKQGVKTLTDCTNAGATAANCLIDTGQLYDLANAQQLSTSIANGQLGGGSGGAKNYLTSYTASTGGGAVNPGNGDFELNATTGWSLAHSALTSGVPTSTASAGTPFDSTHGGTAASGNLSLTIDSTTPIQKKYSGKLTSSAASVAGDMLISSAFYIDTVDQSAPLYISLSSQVLSGASNLNFSGTSSNSFAIYVYDVTAGVWIQPSGVYGMVSSGAFSPKGIYFQPQSSASTRYQLAIVMPNASAGAFSIDFDALGVGPQATVMAPAMSDAVAYTPIFTGFGTVTTSNISYSRRGDKVYIAGNFTSGTPTGVPAQVSFPPGISPDSSLPVAFVVGHGNRNYSVSAANSFSILSGSGATGLYFSFESVSGTNPQGAQNGNSIVGAGDVISFFAEVKVQGWSSNTAASSDTDTRVIAARAYGTTVTAANGANADVSFSTIEYDTAGAFNGTTFTVPQSGIYEVSSGISFASAAHGANGYMYLNLFKNGSVYTSLGLSNFEVAATTYSTFRGTTQVKCNAGDTLKLNFNNASGGTQTADGASTETWVTFKRLSGPAVVQATETISAKYTQTSGQSIPSASHTIMTGLTKVWDDHNICNASTGLCTCPVPGAYQVSGSVGFDANLGSGSYVGVAVAKNGSLDTSLQYVFNGNAYGRPGGSATVRCNQGDTLALMAYQETGSAKSTSGSGTFNWISIVRVGN